MASRKTQANSDGSTAQMGVTPFVPMTLQQRYLVIGLFVVFYLVVLCGTVMVEPEGSTWMLLALLGFVFVRIYPLLFYKRSYGWFHPLIFGALFSMMNLLRSAPAYIFGLDHHIALPTFGARDLMMLMAYQLALEALGLIAFYMGFWLRPSRVKGISKWAFVMPKSMPIKSMVVVGIAMVAFAVYMQLSGGLSTHLLSLGSRRFALAGDFYFLAIIKLGCIACWMWLATQDGAEKKILFWACTLVSLALVSASLGSRGEIVQVIIVGAVIWMMRRRRAAVSLAVPIAVVAILIIALGGELRRSTWYGSDQVGISEETDANSVFESAVSEASARRTSGSGLLAILGRVPGEVELLYGESYLGVLTLPIPRGLWPEKPGLIDGRVGQVFFNSVAAFPSGPVGEAYWNFYIPGVVMIYLLSGLFHSWWTDVIRRHQKESGIFLLHAITLWYFPVFSTATVVSYLLNIIPAFLLLWLLGSLRRVRRQRRFAAVNPSASFNSPPSYLGAPGSQAR